MTCKKTPSDTLYNELCNDIDEELVRPILGKYYYNTGMDCYSCNKIMVKDLRKKYNELLSNNHTLKMGFGLSIILNIILILIKTFS